MDQNFLVGHTGAPGREDAPGALPGLEAAPSPHSTAQEPGSSCGLCQLGPALGAALAARSQNCSSSESCPGRGTGSEGKGWFAPVNPTTLTLPCNHLPGLPAYPHLNCTQLLGQLHWDCTHRPPKENQALGAENATEQGQEKNKCIPLICYHWG